MEQSGEYRINAGRDVVWQSLNDADVLAKCIDGCQSMTRVSDTQFDTTVKAKIGPVSAMFKAELKLTDVNQPASYSINVNAKGGVAGFGKGTAEVTLEEDGVETILRYQVSANVGGKLAQVGSRLIDGVARKMADHFFAAFAREVGASEIVAIEDNGQLAEQTTSNGQWKIWVVVFAALILALVLAF
ncbi:MAG: carbon monoxide dehydrogenase subunit G [Gammaproteobacteria bacterium]|nr:carbon monoxide dehydrogenase subunit G [Gammaproteobacteria bacterium]